MPNLADPRGCGWMESRNASGWWAAISSPQARLRCITPYARRRQLRCSAERVPAKATESSKRNRVMPWYSRRVGSSVRVRDRRVSRSGA